MELCGCLGTDLLTGGRSLISKLRQTKVCCAQKLSIVMCPRRKNGGDEKTCGVSAAVAGPFD